MQRIASAMEQQTPAMTETNATVAGLNALAEGNGAASDEITSTMIDRAKIPSLTRQEVAQFTV